MTFYYVVHKGKKTGIYTSWAECKSKVEGYEGAIYKKFTEIEKAKLFLQVGFGNGKLPRALTKKVNVDKKNQEKIDSVDALDKENTVYIYTDGSCIRKKGIAVSAGYGIHIPSLHVNVSIPLKTGKLTNNRAEMLAIIESVNYLQEEEYKDKKICIFTDSQYSMYIFDKTGQRYKDAGYKKEGVTVPNVDLIERMLEIKAKYNIELLKVRAHTGKQDCHSMGNSVADKLAGDACSTDMKQQKEDSIFTGSLSDSENDLEQEEEKKCINKFAKTKFPKKITKYTNDLEDYLKDDSKDDWKEKDDDVTQKDYNNVNIIIDNNNYAKSKKKIRLKNGNLMKWLEPNK